MNTTTPATTTPATMRELSFSEKAVWFSFNPSNDASVQAIKVKAASFIDFCHTARSWTDDPEKKRMYSLAITEAQTAQMWAVKATTWTL